MSETANLVRPRVETAELTSVLDRMISRYGDEIAVGSIIRCFARSVRELRMAGVRAGLAAAAEAMTDARLRQRLPSGVHAA